MKLPKHYKSLIHVIRRAIDNEVSPADIYMHLRALLGESAPSVWIDSAGTWFMDYSVQVPNRPYVVAKKAAKRAGVPWNLHAAYELFGLPTVNVRRTFKLVSLPHTAPKVI